MTRGTFFLIKEDLTVLESTEFNGDMYPEGYGDIAFTMLKDVINETLEKIGDNPVYITFDLDSLDASVAPAVSNIEPGFTGFTIDEAKELIQAVKNKNVIGGDVVCLMPTKDQKNNITSMVAASIMFEIISVIAYN